MTATTITPEQQASLLAAIRLDQSITWTDADLDEKLSGIIKRGIEYVNDCAGGEKNYMVEGQARSLLFDYCRYARSGALKDFWSDYMKEFGALRSETEVEAYVAETAEV